MQVEQPAIAGSPRHLSAGMACLCGLLGMFLLGWLMNIFNRATQIAPSQDGILNACMFAGFAVAFISAATIFWQLRNQSIVLRVLGAAGIAMLGFGSSAFFLIGITTLFEGWLDFPAGATQTTVETVPIIYAYHQHHRHVDAWHIEVADALLIIAPGDAKFMLDHRLPGDTSGALGQIWSGGYFCAKLTIERAGTAKRVLHTGGNGLAPGSVILCPKANAKPARWPAMTSG